MGLHYNGGGISFLDQWINIQLEKSIMQCIDESIILTSALTITFPPTDNESGRARRVEGKGKKDEG